MPKPCQELHVVFGMKTPNPQHDVPSPSWPLSTYLTPPPECFPPCIPSLIPSSNFWLHQILLWCFLSLECSSLLLCHHISAQTSLAQVKSGLWTYNLCSWTEPALRQDLFKCSAVPVLESLSLWTRASYSHFTLCPTYNVEDDLLKKSLLISLYCSNVPLHRHPLHHFITVDSFTILMFSYIF